MITAPAKSRFLRAPANRSALYTLLLIAGFAALGVFASPWLGEGYASLVFVLGISVVGALYGLWPALFGALLGALLFDYFISEPVFEFNFERTADIAPPLVFLLCAVISGWLSGRLKDEATRANRSNRRLEHLLDISRALQGAHDDSDVYEVLGAADGDHRIGLYRLEDGSLTPIGASPSEGNWADLARAVAQGEREWLGSETLMACALVAGDHRLGALVIEQSRDEIAPLLTQARMVALALEQIGLRLRLGEAHAAARTEELKSALLASVSHDLRSPLTAISTSAASLLAFGPQFDSETSRELLTGIVEESSRLNHLTTNLLQMTRLQSGQEGLFWTDLPVTETLRAIIGRKLRNNAGHLIRLTAPEQDLLVRADTALFDLVLTNVLQNAIHYSPHGSQIAVRCAAEGEDCVITVTDQGIGIPQSEQERVFERFYRVERGDRGPRGTGLGLAIARGFVKACGGSIAITSPVKDGKGTTITIRLPLTNCLPASPNESMTP